MPLKLALVFDKQCPHTTGVYWERACQALGIAYDHWWLQDAARIPADYELYLRVDHGDDYAVVLPRHCRPAVFYAIDTHLPRNWRKIQRAAWQFDLVFCAQAKAAAQLRNGEWLPLGCDLEFHGPRGGEATWDVAFVGNDGGVPRKFYLQALRERYPNSFIGSAEYTQLGSIYSRARVGFNYSIADDMNMRTFEILAAKTLLVTNALSHDSLRRSGFHDQQHLVLYRRPQELFGLIDHFLAHPDQRDRIAQAGHALVRQRHTYADRMQQLLRCVSQRLGISLASRPQEARSCASL